MTKFRFGKKSPDVAKESGGLGVFERASKKTPSPKVLSPYDQYLKDYGNMGLSHKFSGSSSAIQQGGDISPARGRSPGNRGPPASLCRAEAFRRGDHRDGYHTSRLDGDDVASKYSPAGYCGPGTGDGLPINDHREDLLGAASDRYTRKSRSCSSNSRPISPYSTNSKDEGQLSAEEQEHDVQAMKQEIRFIKQEDVASTSNALHLALQAEESGRATLGRLGAQRERLENAERNMDIAAIHDQVAKEKIAELKVARKMFGGLQPENPFKGARMDRLAVGRLRLEEEQRRASHGLNAREGTYAGQRVSTPPYLAVGDRRRTKSSQYQFEADSEDEEMEERIHGNLESLSFASSRLKGLAIATQREVDDQLPRLDIIIQKVRCLSYLIF